MRRSLSAIFIVLSILTAFAAFGVPVNTSWTYQGQLQRSGAAYTGTCDFQFSLWDAVSAGTQQGDTQAINSVNVVNGLFTVVLDFGDFFTGDAPWLGTSVQCSGDGGFTPLDPRQPITPAPYALSLRPGAAIIGDDSTGPLLNVQNSSSINHGHGIAIKGVGHTGLYGSSDSGDGIGVYGHAVGGEGAAVFGENDYGTAIFGISFKGGTAIYGLATDDGYAGFFGGPVRVSGPLSAYTISVNADNSGSGSIAIVGEANETDSVGVYGRNRLGSGIFGSSSGTGPAIYGQNTSTGFAGRFSGPVLVEGNLIVQGALFKNAGSFRIDHPLDPANKFLSHSFVESPDMMNMYNGIVTTDASGSATVTLPDYFAALNRDFRYQLTVLGQFAQAIVSREIAQNSFEIRTDKPGVKVSWQVTGIRQDAYAQEHPIVVEESKPAEEQGLYLFPAGFGAGEEKQIGYPSRPAPTQDAQCPTGAKQSAQAPGK